MNIVYSCDKAYRNLMQVSLLSLLETNRDADSIQVFILGQGMSLETKEKTEEMVRRFSGNVIFMDVDQLCSHRRFWEKEEDCRYVRLLLGDILEEEKVIYLDCDTLVCRSLQTLWETDISACYGGAVLDTARKDARREAGVYDDGLYFNSGVLLLNLKRWRENGLTEVFREYQSGISKGIYRDQRVLNACIGQNMRILPPACNLLPEMLIYRSDQIKRLTGAEWFYSDSELEAAGNAPYIVHFAGRSIDRPWYQNCEHRYREDYRTYMSKDKRLWVFGLCRDKKWNCIKWKIRKRLPFRMVLFLAFLKNRQGGN